MNSVFKVLALLALTTQAAIAEISSEAVRPIVQLFRTACLEEDFNFLEAPARSPHRGLAQLDPTQASELIPPTALFGHAWVEPIRKKRFVLLTYGEVRGDGTIFGNCDLMIATENLPLDAYEAAFREIFAHDRTDQESDEDGWRTVQKTVTLSGRYYAIEFVSDSEGATVRLNAFRVVGRIDIEDGK